MTNDQKIIDKSIEILGEDTTYDIFKDKGMDGLVEALLTYVAELIEEDNND